MTVPQLTSILSWEHGYIVTSAVWARSLQSSLHDHLRSAYAIYRQLYSCCPPWALCRLHRHNYGKPRHPSIFPLTCPWRGQIDANEYRKSLQIHHLSRVLSNHKFEKKKAKAVLKYLQYCHLCNMQHNTLAPHSNQGALSSNWLVAAKFVALRFYNTILSRSRNKISMEFYSQQAWKVSNM